MVKKFLALFLVLSMFIEPVVPVYANITDPSSDPLASTVTSTVPSTTSTSPATSQTSSGTSFLAPSIVPDPPLSIPQPAVTLSAVPISFNATPNGIVPVYRFYDLITGKTGTVYGNRPQDGDFQFIEPKEIFSLPMMSWMRMPE